MSATHVAFVRAVMIGREGLHRPVLLDMFERAGATEATSYIATGNVSFRAETDAVPAVVESVEAALEALLGRPTPLFVRPLDALIALVESNPFADPPRSPVRDEVVTFFRESVPAHLEPPIEAPNGDFVAFAAGPGELFSVVVDRVDRQPSAPGGYLERLAREPATTRAISTIERIVAKLT